MYTNIYMYKCKDILYRERNFSFSTRKKCDGGGVNQDSLSFNFVTIIAMQFDIVIVALNLKENIFLTLPTMFKISIFFLRAL